MRNILLLLAFLCIGLSARHPLLKVGDTCPVKEVSTVQGSTVDLRGLNDEKVLITFFRYAACPICNYRVHELSEAYDSLSAEGFVLVGVFESSEELMRQYASEYEVPFHVVADPEGSLYEQFSVPVSLAKTAKYGSRKRVRTFHKKGATYYKGSKYKRDGKLFRSTADFVVTQEKLTWVHYNKVIGDHTPLKDL